jgi:hypothetical protein
MANQCLQLRENLPELLPASVEDQNISVLKELITVAVKFIVEVYPHAFFTTALVVVFSVNLNLFLRIHVGKPNKIEPFLCPNIQ